MSRDEILARLRAFVDENFLYMRPDFELRNDASLMGNGIVDSMGVMEAIGAALIVEPYLPTVGLGAQFVARAGTAAQKQRILPAVVEGDLTLAFAQSETGARYDLARVATRAHCRCRRYQRLPRRP